MTQVIIIGGGLAGLSAAHTVLERGGRVLVLDKNPFLGGNSTKATSGINGALTKTQIAKGIPDSAEKFEKDTVASAGHRLQPELVKVLTHQSGPAVEWLQDRFNLDLSLVSRLGGHSEPRTHRGKEKFPGFTITYALMEKLEQLAAQDPTRVRIIIKARATKLLQDSNGHVNGVVYEHAGQSLSEYGPVILATGGYAADFTENSLLNTYRPDLKHLPTTNGDHCTGDGIKMTQAIGGGVVDMEFVQVHPTGLVFPDDPDAKVLFLAAEALRGVGGLILDKDGLRFCDELGRRDYVTGEMWSRNKAPYRLVLNEAASKEIEWHCKHYVGRGVMKKFSNGKDLAKEMGINESVLRTTFDKYNQAAKAGTDEYGKKFYHNVPFKVDETYHVAIITPVVHYCMGGVALNADSEVLSTNGKPIGGLYATGEVCGGVHGKNRLGGNSLLDCVVYGRVSGAIASKYLLDNLITKGGSNSRLGALGQQLGLNIQVKPNGLTLDIQLGSAQSSSPASTQPQTNTTATSNVPASTQAPTSTAAAPAKRDTNKKITKEEVAAHNKESDLWVILNGKVYDVTKFLPDHPGGKKAILIYGGKDASEEFNMLHQADVVDKYAPDAFLGLLAE